MRLFLSKLLFFSKGRTTADLKILGKDPETKLSLIMLVIAGRSSSRHSINKGVGMASSGQVVGFEVSMVFLTSSTETGLKQSKMISQALEGVTKVEAAFDKLSNSALIFDTFDKKNSQNASGKEVIGIEVGRGLDWVFPIKLLVMLNSCLEHRLSEIFWQ